MNNLSWGRGGGEIGGVAREQQMRKSDTSCRIVQIQTPVTALRAEVPNEQTDRSKSRTQGSISAICEKDISNIKTLRIKRQRFGKGVCSVNSNKINKEF